MEKRQDYLTRNGKDKEDGEWVAHRRSVDTGWLWGVGAIAEE